MVPVLVLASDALAADVVGGANLLGMGGVGAAASRDNAGITLNPGLLGLHARYDFLGLFRYGPNAGNGAGLAWGVSAMDSRTSDAVALGLSYSGDTYEPPLGTNDLPGWTVPGSTIPNQKRFHDFAAGLAVPAFDRKLSLGLGANVGLYDHDRQGSGVTFDVHLGVGVRPVEWLVLGAAVRDLLPGQEQDRPLGVVGGVRVEAERLFAVETNVDWRDEFTVGLPVTLASGFEARASSARIRLGWRRDAADGIHSVTAGLGWDEEGAAIEYGIRVPLDHPRFDATVHAVSLRFGAPLPIPEP